MNDEVFQKKVSDFADLVDAELLRLVAMEEQIPDLHEGMIYAMGLDVPDRKVRGKRIRPVLCLVTAEALGAEARQALSFAAAIELLHNFALIHDDIEDGDTHRRGRDSTYRRYGLPHGINIGDYMFAKVFSTVWRDPHQTLPVREQLIELLNKTMDDLFVGQALDISARRLDQFTMADYERLVMKKTGSYLAAPMLGGALIAEADEEVIIAIGQFGRAMGPMFQIKDDIIDLTTGKGRSSIGSDIREGKRSYLVAVVSDLCTASEKEQLYAILDKPREQTNAADVEWSIALFNKYRVLERAEEHCEELRQHGMEVIADTPPELRSVLELAAETLAKRTT